MTRRLSLITLGVTAPLVLLTFLIPFPGGELVFGLAVVLFPVALMALGASRQGSTGPVTWPLLGLLMVLVVVVVGMFVVRGQVTDGPWWGGLPAGAALQLYGLFLLPLLISSLGYARTFEGWSLRDDELTQLRQRFAKPSTADDEDRR